MADLVSNTDEIDPQGSIDAIVLDTGPPPDRLPPMLFLAALIHGILIIGITFNAVIDDAFSEAISLDVTIVADPEHNVLVPEQADYIAQASQEGVGNTRERARPGALAESVVPINNPGDESGDSLEESTILDKSADQVLTTRAEQDLNTMDKPREDPTPDESTAIRMEAGVELTLPLPQEEIADAAIHDDNPRELVTSVNTRESKIAPYLDRWKRKIETIGVKYFPEHGLIDGITGSPTLEVIISSSGQLQDVIVRKASGSRILDQAALEILHRAAPFDPFPEAVRVDYDTLRFAYKWQFSRVSVQSTASTN
jgi:protein TonB